MSIDDGDCVLPQGRSPQMQCAAIVGDHVGLCIVKRGKESLSTTSVYECRHAHALQLRKSYRKAHYAVFAGLVLWCTPAVLTVFVGPAFWYASVTPSLALLSLSDTYPAALFALCDAFSIIE